MTTIQPKGHTHRCPVCDALYFPKRSDAIYCSAKCRQQAKRGKINRVKDDTQSFYQQGVNLLNKLKSHEAQRQIRVLAMSMIESLDDSERRKLYEALKSDIHRVNCDTSVTRSNF